jgi:YHS domain-containing protein
MLRSFVYVLIGLFLITFLRLVAGVLFKGIGEMLQPNAPETRTASKSGNVPAGGELKRDPVCGTFVATSSSLNKTVGGETVYFCSPACRDKYVA